MNAMLSKSLQDQRRPFVGWAIGVAAMAVMYTAFYPSIRSSAGVLTRYIQNMPEAFRNLIGGDFISPAGYLRSEVFTVLGPILFLIFAVSAGARAIAGEEEAGTLDLLLSTPVRRRRVLVDKTLAIGVAMVGLGVVLWLAIVLVGPAFQLHVALTAVASGVCMLVLLGTAFGAVALAVGTATGHKGLADAVAGGFALVTYIVNAVAPQVSALRPFRPLCPFRWYFDPDPIKTGLHAANLAVLLGIIAVGVAVALFTFERRDLAA